MFKIHIMWSGSGIKSLRFISFAEVFSYENGYNFMTPLKIIRTADGSTTVFNKELNEIYHSVNGAVTESKHVFINAGLHYQLAHFQVINLLEIGFGTGLNALLSLIEIQDSSSAINYETCEPYPLDKSLISKLDFSIVANAPSKQDWFEKIHHSSWNVKVRISKNFILKKLKIPFEKMLLKPAYYHLVYLDAFSPDVQPELWTEQIFEKLFRAMTNNSVLVTYSAKGNVRRNIIKTGFEVERLKGPKGKREMLKAVKQ